MGVCGSRLKPWRGAPGAVDRTARFLAVILIAAIENCSGSGWREHGKLCGLMLILCGVILTLHNS